MNDICVCVLYYTETKFKTKSVQLVSFQSLKFVMANSKIRHRLQVMSTSDSIQVKFYSCFVLRAKFAE